MCDGAVEMEKEKTYILSIKQSLLLPNFWLFIFYVSKKVFQKKDFLFKGEIERIESLLVDWGLNCENREPRGQIRKSREAKVEIEFLWDLIASNQI